MDGVNLYHQFLALHKPQLETSGVPERFWETVYKKITNEIFDAGSAFSLMLIDYGDLPRDELSPVWTVCVNKSLSVNNPNEIYLIDHAWTFKTNQAKQQLQLYPQLSTRMAIIMGIDKDDPERNNKILQNIWRYCQSYSVQSEHAAVEARMPVWYVMDELGCGVNYSDEPNCRIVPFLHIPTQLTYSLLFPITSIEEGDLVTRDFVENIARDMRERDALLLPWKYTDFRREDFSQKEPDVDYFLSGHIAESIPEGSVSEPQLSRDDPIKVFSEYDVLTRSLTSASFEVIDNEENADILWLNRHFKDFEELCRDSPNKFINQFPYEYVITIKDLLGIVCRRRSKAHHDNNSLETFPKWLPTTYNLNTELVEFVSYFQHREDKDLDNHWIIKPWNLARGLDTHITNNLAHIMRLQPTGPKIAQKYVENPVLFYREEIGHRVKFDIRFVILLKTVQPLEAYVYTNFFLRFANKPFSLDNFHDYEKHFTVMNYADEAELRHMRCEEFITTWKEQYPENNWEGIEDEMCNVLNEVLLCATGKPPPCGIAANPQSRALYAADIMLAWEGDRIQPKLLEINWMPDCKRAAEYYPEFYNDIFKLLFLNEIDEEMFRLITKAET